MIKEFCNIVHIYLKNQVEHITADGLVVAKPGEDPIIVHAADFNFNPAVTDSNASLLKNYSETLYIDKLQPSDAEKLRIKRSVIIQLKVNTNESFLIGTLSYPAKIILTQNLNADTLKIEHKQPAYS